MTQKNTVSTSLMIGVREGKLIAALMSSEIDFLHEVEQRLCDTFGTIELSSDLYLFDKYSVYYVKEMGTNQHKKFISFADMIAVETLPEIKLFTNDLEQKYTVDGNRRINIDPGYVTHGQMVLATTKAFSHRIYYGKGVFAELTYICKGKEFYPLEWTYPDYREPSARQFFTSVREAYLRETRA